MTATRRTIDGRMHLQHGPIDLLIEADGEPDAVDAAHRSAWRRFEPLLDELVAELPLLKRPVDGGSWPAGPVARRMVAACRPHRARFVTPMAAVAGAVADELIDCYRRPGVRRAWVNNGGDIAFHLAPSASARVGLFADLARFDPRREDGPLPIDADFELTSASPVRGVATSGWRGRSFSLGIADSVTVLALDAAGADAAATMIANAVDVDDPRIVRRPASACKDDSDLGDRLVTLDVPVLGIDVVRRALAQGRAHAEALCDEGLVLGALLVCQGMMATVGALHAIAPRVRRPAMPRAMPWHTPGLVSA